MPIVATRSDLPSYFTLVSLMLVSEAQLNH